MQKAIRPASGYNFEVLLFDIRSNESRRFSQKLQLQNEAVPLAMVRERSSFQINMRPVGFGYLTMAINLTLAMPIRVDAHPCGMAAPV